MSVVIAMWMCWHVDSQPALYSSNELWSRLGQPGVAVGLAWTTVGGEVLLVEANKMEGDGELVLTGHLGDVMKESAKLALNWVRTSARQVIHSQFSLLLPDSSDISWLCILYPVHLILEYGAVCWDPYRECQISALGRVQNKGAICPSYGSPVWEPLLQRGRAARMCAPYRAYNGERAWTGYRRQTTWVKSITAGKFFVNRPPLTTGTSLVKTHVFRQRVGRVQQWRVATWPG
jgi:hypothetical protein